MSRLFNVVCLVLALVVFMWLAGATMIANSSQSYSDTFASKASFDKLEQRVSAIDAKLDSHIQDDYKTFNHLYSIDKDTIGEIKTKLAVLETNSTNMFRVMWGILAAIGINILSLIGRFFKLSISKPK